MKALSRQSCKRLMVLFFAISIIVALVLDITLKPCSAAETTPQTLQRLFCAGVLPSNGTDKVLIPEVINCTTPDALDSDYTFNDETELCEKESSCVEHMVSKFSKYVENNIVEGFFLNIVVFAVASLVLIPGIFLTIATGAAFGMALGLGWGVFIASLSTWIGAMLSTFFSFYGARYLFREHVRNFIQTRKKLKAIDHAVQEKGTRIVMLLRLSPIIPFGIFNYLMGSTSCSFRGHFLATAVGILPGTVAYSFVGAGLGSSFTYSDPSDGCDENDMIDGYFMVSEVACHEPGFDAVNISLLVVGIVATIVAMAIVTVQAKKQLKVLLLEGKEDKPGEVRSTNELFEEYSSTFENSSINLNTETEVSTA